MEGIRADFFLWKELGQILSCGWNTEGFCAPRGRRCASIGSALPHLLHSLAESFFAGDCMLVLLWTKELCNLSP